MEDKLLRVSAAYPGIVATAREHLVRTVRFLIGETTKSAARVSMLACTAAIAVVLSGCASSGTQSSQGLPNASDGTNLQACASGNCEVRVGPSTQIPLPSSMLVEALQVQSIGSNSVTVTGRSTDNFLSPRCSRNCRSSSSNGSFQFTFSARGEGSVNKLDVTMVGTDGKSAVLRIAPNVSRR